MRIGIDLDNTLIDYGSLFVRLAREEGLVDMDFDTRTALRNAIRQQHGDEAWQRLQAFAYGPRICEAELFPFVLQSLRELRSGGHHLYIVSHKTRYSNLLGKRGPDLHKTARRFLSFSRLDELVEEVFFLPDQEAKCAAIAEIDCDFFIDDLQEVLVHPSFPVSCQPIFFNERVASWTGITFSSWQVLPALLEPGSCTGELLTGGRNSRTLRSENLVFKYYHNDSRNRCRNELQALEWLREQGVVNIPSLLGCAPHHYLTILEYVEGSSPSGNEQDAKSMLDFALRLYELRHNARHLPCAADAAFCLRDIAEQIEKRIRLLHSVADKTSVQQAMHCFVRERLEPAFRFALNACPDFGVLEQELRMPSPSDFGLHNALVRPDGKLVFLDFEYFGLDDPAKFLADILLHPGMNLGWNLRKKIVTRFLRFSLAADAELEQRTVHYLPLWKIKWCCILLNEFLVSENQRRDFARNHIADNPNRQAIQLQKAQTMLEQKNCFLNLQA